MGRMSEPFHAEVECAIFGRLAAKVSVETGEVVPEAGTSGKMSGRMGEKFADTQQP